MKLIFVVWRARLTAGADSPGESLVNSGATHAHYLLAKRHPKWRFVKNKLDTLNGGTRVKK